MKLPSCVGYVTVGTSCRRVEPGTITADMSWLGEPPTAEQSARYEQVRASRILAATHSEIAALEAESRQLQIDISASESPVRRQKLVERLQAANSRISECYTRLTGIPRTRQRPARSWMVLDVRQGSVRRATMQPRD